MAQTSPMQSSRQPMTEPRWVPGVFRRFRRTGRPTAVIHCTQEIPCNPCEEACPHGAIRIGPRISRRPILNRNKCTGCGLCIPVCPGLAIRVIDRTYSSEYARVKIPHEFLPTPTRGDYVTVQDGAGKRLCAARVLDVINPSRNDRTAVVDLAVPQALANEAMSIALAGKGGRWIQQP